MLTYLFKRNECIKKIDILFIFGNTKRNLADREAKYTYLGIGF